MCFATDGDYFAMEDAATDFVVTGAAALATAGATAVALAMFI